MQHALWLYRNKSERADERLVSDFLELTDMHLRGVVEDGSDQQSFHFRRAISTNWMALAVGEAIWGKRDRRLTPIVYSLVHQYYLQAMAVDWGGRTGYELRQVAPGSDWVRERSDMRRYYYFTGMGLLRQLQAIYSAPESPDPEALAMATLYLADWQVLFGRHGEALQSYLQAYRAMETAGVDPVLKERFFSSPSVLPETEFYPSIAQALATREKVNSLAHASESWDGDFLFFAEWSAAFPYVNRPLQSMGGGAEAASNFALFSFNLAGVSEIPLFIDNRNSTEFGSVQDARLVESATQDSYQQDRLLRRLQWLKFRPKLIDGLPQDFAATLHYQLAGEP